MRMGIRVYPEQVLLGARTSTTANADAQSSAKHKIGNTGVGDDGGGAQFAEHFVVEAEEPSTGETCRIVRL